MEGQFASAWQTLYEASAAVEGACEQVRDSLVLREVLQRVLAIGNHLNGSSNRGGAYGFKLADLSKLVQVGHAVKVHSMWGTAKIHSIWGILLVSENITFFAGIFA